jgi:hypothetical protein
VSLLRWVGRSSGLEGLALASSGGGVIHACANKKTGALRLATECKKKQERAISWNLQGPQGRTGAAGATGQQGPQGLPGTNGSNGATNVVVRTTTESVTTGSSSQMNVSCNPGERATGGGVGTSEVSSASIVEASYPTGALGGPAGAGQTPVGWFSGVFNNLGITLTATHYVVCASP